MKILVLLALGIGTFAGMLGILCVLAFKKMIDEADRNYKRNNETEEEFEKRKNKK